eukprot:CAMPEP_0174874476 /NCGR_PEP_ID=MMETSP1114-20130205/76757_1 /TAXON_ID=312471 /ORGANISM="Neobodo designis, Strain CCAP 1951/1" /LENGTH=235 /DNA_ID=CAMNT_0016109807 /DNA_START=23 /DNA_END=727 /DNA_ORIENTATION=+
MSAEGDQQQRQEGAGRFVGRPLTSYFVLLSDMQRELPVPRVTDVLTSCATDAAETLPSEGGLKALAAEKNVRFVPTKLHVFKERPPQKWGFVQYVAAVVPVPGSGSTTVPELADDEIPSLAALNTAFIAWLDVVSAGRTPHSEGVAMRASLCTSDVVAALDSCKLVSEGADPLKMLCLVGAKLSAGVGATVGQQPVLDLAAFSALELSVVRDCHSKSWPDPANSAAIAAFFAFPE